MKRKQLDIEDFTVTKKKTTINAATLRLSDEKKFAKVISSHKLVHARDIDPSDTVIVKSLYPDCQESLRWKQFSLPIDVLCVSVLQFVVCQNS